MPIVAPEHVVVGVGGGLLPPPDDDPPPLPGQPASAVSMANAISLVAILLFKAAARMA
ncbi:MAG: hypothetical protein JJ920_08635 [Roseitalea sp.]|nr:hypothetical protein [Roseitalea sp.]MBO6722492.1 hypothetical protein [Roseitalea sp.]MBO6742964.1 hypothetical protein [Roseitalea sp.]